MNSIMTLLLSATLTLVFVAASIHCFDNRPIKEHWVPIGSVGGEILYERSYPSGKKAWRLVDKYGNHDYLHASTVQDMDITPL